MAKKLTNEHLLVPSRGTYFPWSAGLQNCPGEKFSRVEFVAVKACLFQKHRVQLVHPDDMSCETARKHILNVCEDSELGLLLRMRKADNVRLLWRHV